MIKVWTDVQQLWQQYSVQKEALIILLLFNLNAFGDVQSCKPKDLRDTYVAPIRTQLYLNDDGEVVDSNLCYAYALANLISQKLGLISPESIGIGLWAYRDKGVTVRDAIRRGHSRNILFVANNSRKNGYCLAQNFEMLLPKSQEQSLLTSLVKFYGDLDTQQMAMSANWVCGTRKKLPDEYSVVEEYVAHPFVQIYEERQEVMLKIDQLLDQDKFVAMSYGRHYVTIVGRTADCQYIIQDSIPNSYYAKTWGENSTVKHVGEFQYWSKEILRAVVKSIAYIK